MDRGDPDLLPDEKVSRTLDGLAPLHRTKEASDTITETRVTDEVTVGMVKTGRDNAIAAWSILTRKSPATFWTTLVPNARQACLYICLPLNIEFSGTGPYKQGAHHA